MSTKRILTILLPSIALTFGSQVNAYTLQEAVRHTLLTSPDFLIQTNNRDTIDKQLRVSYGAYLPTLEMNAGWGEQYTNNPTTRFSNPLVGPNQPQEGTRTETRTEWGLLANQMLFDGFSVFHDVEGHKARVRAESWRVKSTAQDVTIDAVRSYMDVLERRELVKLNRENLANHERVYGQIEKRSESGIGRKADLDQAYARVALAKTNLFAEEGNLRDAETKFLRNIGIPVPTHLVKPEKPHPFPANVQEAVELGVRTHPTLRASIHDVEVVREDHRGSRAAFYPKIDLQLEVSNNHNVDGTTGATQDALAMVRMRWNLFNGGRDLAKVCETAYHMQQAIEIEHRAHRQVIDAVRLAWSGYQTATSQMKYLQEHVDASIRTLDAYQKQFNIGQRTLLDVLDSLNELFSARNDYIKARYTQLLGMYHILNATGTLTEALGVELPRQAIPVPSSAMDGAFRFFERTSPLFDRPQPPIRAIEPLFEY